MTDRLTRAPRSGRELVSRLVESPELVRAVQALEPRALATLVDHVGLEDAGALVALATTAQLEGVFDEDLWRAERPGVAERFDPERFGVWLQVMLEVGPTFAARTLAELPEDLVTLAVRQMALVIDMDALGVELADADEGDNDLVEKALDSVLSHELGAYRLVARHAEGWDALVTVLVELDEEHHELLDRLLARAAHATAGEVADSGGLYAVLTDDELLEIDAAAAREDRRAAAGYVAPSDAAAFLTGARQTPLEALAADTERDPITRAYFRDFARRARTAAPPTGDGAADAAALTALLEESGVAASAPRQLTGGSELDEPLLGPALQALAARDEAAAGARVEELGYLANLLVAGATVGGRALRPFEAAEAALATASLGLEHRLGAPRTAARAAALLEKTGVDALFRLGWHLLGRDLGGPRLAATACPTARAPDGSPRFVGTLAALAAARRTV